jgi:nitrogen regulatory protein P-II 1
MNRAILHPSGTAANLAQNSRMTRTDPDGIETTWFCLYRFYGISPTFDYPGQPDGNIVNLRKSGSRRKGTHGCAGITHSTFKVMKKIETIIQPFKLDDVKDALGDVGIEEITVSEVKACGHRKTRTEIFRGTEFQVEFLPEIKIELVLQDNRMEAAVAAIIKGTKTTRTAAGQILVSDVNDAVLGKAEVTRNQPTWTAQAV